MSVLHWNMSEHVGRSTAHCWYDRLILAVSMKCPHALPFCSLHSSSHDGGVKGCATDGQYGRREDNCHMCMLRTWCMADSWVRVV